MALWLQNGTVAITQGQTVVVGTGTTFKTALNPAQTGQPIIIRTASGLDMYEIESVQDDTHLTLAAPVLAATAGSLKYIIPVTIQGSFAALANRAALVMSEINGLVKADQNLSELTQPDVALGHLGISALMIKAIKAGSVEDFISAIGLGSGNLGFIPSHGNSTLSGILTLASFVSTGENHLALGAYTDPASSRSAAIKIGSGGLVVKGGIWSVDNQGTSPQDVVRYDYLDNNFYRKVSPGGVLEIGNMIDFHTTGDTSDYSLRLHAGNGYLLTLGYHSANEYRLPSDLGGIKPEGSSASPVTRLWGTNIASVTGKNEAILAFNANHTGAAWEKIDPAKSSHIISVSQYGLVHYSASATDANPTQNSTLLIDDGTLKSGTYDPIFDSVTAKNESHFAIGSYSDPSPGRSAAVKIGSGGLVVKGGIWSVDSQGASAQDVTRKDYVDGKVSSDIKLKSNIKPIPEALNAINHLNGYTFTKIEWPLETSGEYAGVIAQEVESVLPQAVKEAIGESDSVKVVDPLALCGLLIEAVKALGKEVEDLKAKLKIA